jgi:ribosome assembly protein YihI (activator of Der GTPase)
VHCRVQKRKAEEEAAAKAKAKKKKKKGKGRKGSLYKSSSSANNTLKKGTDMPMKKASTAPVAALTKKVSGASSPTANATTMKPGADP